MSDLSYFALFATKTKPHYVEMVLIVTGGGGEPLKTGRVKRAGQNGPGGCIIDGPGPL